MMTEETKHPMADEMDGWVIVPCEPTIAMDDAAMEFVTWEDILDECPAYPASEAVARLVEALKEIRFLWAGHSEECAHILSGFKEKCDCDWPKVRDKCDAALSPFLTKE